LVLTDGFLTERAAKTAHGVIRYSDDAIAAVLDHDHAGKRLSDVMPELGRDAPIVATVAEGAELGANTLLLGVATPGGWMPDHWRTWIVDALERGMEVVNGLHRFLRDDPEFVRLANEHGARLWDVRDPPKDIPLCSGKALEAPQKIIATVGSDCAVGKKTVAIELARAGAAKGAKTEFVATGQTGIMIAGRGIAVDRVIADFLAGAAEKLVVEARSDSEVLIIEGQGSLWHPAYSGVTLGLLHGSAPHSLVFCHKAGHTEIEEPPFTKLPSVPEMIRGYEEAAATLRPARVACVAINSQHLSEVDARRAIAEIEDEAGLPAGDVLAGDAPKLWDAVASDLG
jgi:uncharacterized NAD-dependent epimerase/dehydratase family protein